MPTSSRRHRVEISGDLYTALAELAAREGYPVGRFTDKLLYLAVWEYAKARKRGLYPFAGGGIRLPADER